MLRLGDWKLKQLDLGNRLALQEKVVQHTAGKLVCIKDHVPFVVTKEDIEDHDGSFDSALHSNTVDAEKVI